MFAEACIYMRVYMCLCVFIDMPVRIHERMCTHACAVHAHVCKYVCTYVCVFLVF